MSTLASAVKMTQDNRFGKNLKRWLVLNHLKQKDLAEWSGLTSAAISQIISGQRMPQLATLLAILYALHIPLELLLENE